MKYIRPKQPSVRNLLWCLIALGISANALSQGSVAEDGRNYGGNSRSQDGDSWDGRADGDSSEYQVPCKGFNWGHCASQCRTMTARIDGGRGCASLCSRTAQTCEKRLNEKLRTADRERLKRGGWTIETWAKYQEDRLSGNAKGYVTCSLRNWQQSPRDRDSTCSSWWN